MTVWRKRKEGHGGAGVPNTITLGTLVITRVFVVTLALIFGRILVRILDGHHVVQTERVVNQTDQV